MDGRGLRAEEKAIGAFEPLPKNDCTEAFERPGGRIVGAAQEIRGYRIALERWGDSERMPAHVRALQKRRELFVSRLFALGKFVRNRSLFPNIEARL
jgi:hypothetical protein